MRLLIATLALLFGALAWLTCAPEPPPKPPELIATVEGCHVWKIDAGRRYVYSTICPDGRSATTFTPEQQHLLP